MESINKLVHFNIPQSNETIIYIGIILERHVIGKDRIRLANWSAAVMEYDILSSFPFILGFSDDDAPPAVEPER